MFFIEHSVGKASGFCIFEVYKAGWKGGAVQLHEAAQQ